MGGVHTIRRGHRRIDFQVQSEHEKASDNKVNEEFLDCGHPHDIILETHEKMGTEAPNIPSQRTEWVPKESVKENEIKALQMVAANSITPPTVGTDR